MTRANYLSYIMITKKLRNEITKDKRDSKKVYFTAYFERNVNKSVIICKGIKSLVNIKLPRCFTIISPLLAPKLNKKYQTGNFKNYLNRRDAKGKLFINSSNNSLFLSPTVPMEVEKIIDGLDMKKATGSNSIPNIILKSFKHFFSVWLSRLKNLCFEVGVFPTY